MLPALAVLILLLTATVGRAYELGGVGGVALEVVVAIVAVAVLLAPRRRTSE